jgi:diguanylate cyclase (GGDEF)-like protein
MRLNEGMTTMNLGKVVRWKAGRRDRIILLGLSLGWILLAGFAHYLTGPQYEFHLVFLIPVIAVCWFIGFRPGVLSMLFSAVVWMIADWQYVTDRKVLLLNEVVRLSVFFLFVVLSDRLRSAIASESTFARVDALTQLPNRRDFYEFAGAEITRSRRYGHPISVISLDLDHFKSVNDRNGHDTGDRVLRTVAETLRKNIRSMDIAARIGGDEFVILLPETGPDASEEFAAKLQQKLTQAMLNEGWTVTGSFGVATFIKAPTCVDELIKQSDLLLYSAKHKGKNMICYEVIQR